MVTWWAPSTNTPDSGLHRLLFGRALRQRRACRSRRRCPSDDQAATVLAALAARGGPVIEPAIPARVPAEPVRAPDQREPACGAFDRTVDTGWRRTSYSALAAAAEDHGSAARSTPAGVSSEPESGERDDESMEPPPDAGSGDADSGDAGSAEGGSVGSGSVGAGSAEGGSVGSGSVGAGSAEGGSVGSGSVGAGSAEGGSVGSGSVGAGSAASGPRLVELLAVRSPMADLPAGTSFGTLVHAVLETTDPTRADLPAELRLRSTEQMARRPIGVSAEELAAALLPVLSTPLGPIADDLALRDFPVRDRLTELDFEIPLAGGDGADSDDGAVTLGDLGDLVRQPADRRRPARRIRRTVGSPAL